MSDLSLPTRGQKKKKRVKKKNAMGCCHIIPGQFALRVMLSRSEGHASQSLPVYKTQPYLWRSLSTSREEYEYIGILE